MIPLHLLRRVVWVWLAVHARVIFLPGTISNGVVVSSTRHGCGTGQRGRRAESPPHHLGLQWPMRICEFESSEVQSVMFQHF